MDSQRSIPAIEIPEYQDTGIPVSESYMSISPASSEDGDNKEQKPDNTTSASAVTGSALPTNLFVEKKPINEEQYHSSTNEGQDASVQDASVQDPNVDRMLIEDTDSNRGNIIPNPSHEGKNKTGEGDRYRHDKRCRADVSNDSSVLEMISEQSNDSDKKSSPFTTEPPSKVPRIELPSRDANNEKKKDENLSEDSSFDGDSLNSGAITEYSNRSQLTYTARKIGMPVNVVSSRPSTDGDSLQKNFDLPECDEYFLSLVKLHPIPDASPLQSLTTKEVSLLESALQIGPRFRDYSDDWSWKGDWNGNLQLLHKDIILNRDVLASNPSAKKITMTFFDSVTKHARHPDDFASVRHLFSYVYNMPDIPAMAKQILAHYIQRPVASILERQKSIVEAIDRISYDPIVLNQDGWTTAKVDVPDSATGGAFMIGRKILWERFPAVVIAFVHDEGLGDLWKCMWTDDLDTFDLEADELQEGIKRWERKMAREKENNKQSKVVKSSTSARFEQSRNFTVKGVEDGIILATSYKAKTGRPWPARIMHVAEIKSGQLTSRRSSSKNEIHVVFLAPYWNNQAVRSTNASSTYESGPLFELETIDVSENTIQEYPYDIKDGTLSIDKLRTAFSFLGLPKSALRRYLNSHRIAMALKTYAHKMNSKNVEQSSNIDALSSMTETHPLSVKTFLFPEALLCLPFEYTLQKYPKVPDLDKVTKIDDDDIEETEPIIKLSQMLESLCPPLCWNNSSSGTTNTDAKLQSPYRDELKLVTKSPEKIPLPIGGLTKENSFNYQQFCSKFIIDKFEHEGGAPIIPLQALKRTLEDLVSQLNGSIVEVESVSNPQERQSHLRTFLLDCLTTKVRGLIPCI